MRVKECLNQTLGGVADGGMRGKMHGMNMVPVLYGAARAEGSEDFAEKAARGDTAALRVNLVGGSVT